MTRTLKIVAAWTLLTLAWCAFVIVLAGRLHAQTPGCYVIDRYQMLCIPSTGEIFVDVAAGRGHLVLLYAISGDSRQESNLHPNTAATPRIILAHQKLASDAWIDKGRNKKGERCCDSGKDCFSVPPERIEHVRDGVNIWLNDGRKVFVPGNDIMPSEDGKWWLCYWDNQVKCVFAPYSGS